jgi:hypothetical protein
MTIRRLLIVTAVIEVGTGMAMAIAPSLPVSLLIGSALDTPAALTVGRVAGAALLSLGVACWLAREDEQSRATRGLIAAMLLYDAGVVALLAHAGLVLGLSGPGLWPAILLHAVMAVWCLASLRIGLVPEK